MAQAVERLGVPAAAGRVAGEREVRSHGKPGRSAARWIEFNECGHPVPDERGGLARSASGDRDRRGQDDLVICLVSGGASALLPFPAPPVTLAEKQEVTRLLLASGADIHEINAVRKHISLLKGGQLARMAYPARVLSLILSDVIGDDLDVIGSGLTAPDASTFSGAEGVLEKYNLSNRVPPSVSQRLAAACAAKFAKRPRWRSGLRPHTESDRRQQSSGR
jgi:glycerate-2-kinase